MSTASLHHGSTLYLDPLSVLYLNHEDPKSSHAKTEIEAHLHQKCSSNPVAVSYLLQAQNSVPKPHFQLVWETVQLQVGGSKPSIVADKTGPLVMNIQK